MTKERSRAEFEQFLIECAVQHPEFKDRLLKDPKRAISEFSDMKLPAELNVVVHEETRNTLHLVLPYGGSQLNAAELMRVTGSCWSHYSCLENYPYHP